jgi:hypothetical protein
MSQGALLLLGLVALLLGLTWTDRQASPSWSCLAR